MAGTSRRRSNRTQRIRDSTRPSATDLELQQQTQTRQSVATQNPPPEDPMEPLLPPHEEDNGNPPVMDPFAELGLVGVEVIEHNDAVEAPTVTLDSAPSDEDFQMMLTPSLSPINVPNSHNPHGIVINKNKDKVCTTYINSLGDYFSCVENSPTAIKLLGATLSVHKRRTIAKDNNAAIGPSMKSVVYKYIDDYDISSLRIKNKSCPSRAVSMYVDLLKGYHPATEITFNVECARILYIYAIYRLGSNKDYRCDAGPYGTLLHSLKTYFLQHSNQSDKTEIGSWVYPIIDMLHEHILVHKLPNILPQEPEVGDLDARNVDETDTRGKLSDGTYICVEKRRNFRTDLGIIRDNYAGIELEHVAPYRYIHHPVPADADIPRVKGSPTKLVDRRNSRKRSAPSALNQTAV